MESIDHVHQNRSGTRRAPERLNAMRDVPVEIDIVDADSRGPTADELRAEAAAGAEPIGSIGDSDVPPTLPALLDRLGGRLAFERSGVRLYDAILRKVDLEATSDAEKCRADLHHIRAEELEHAQMLGEILIALDGDPTSETPCADLEGVMSSGLVAVVNDPRTTLVDALQAALIAELADVDAWTHLRKLARPFVSKDVLADFTRAEKQEADHLAKIRAWFMRFESRLFEIEDRA